MVNNYKGIGVGFSPDVLNELDCFASSRGMSRAEAIRISVAIGFPMLKLGVALNAERALTILEHTQLALSLLVERQYPEDVNELINQALSNVREYHG